MNGFITNVLVTLAFLLPNLSYAHEYTEFDTHMQECYAEGMIGYDSVINSRLGVPPEHALDLTLKSHATPASVDAYDTNILTVFLGAYLWKSTPHSYAIKVFYNCATRSKTIQSAKIN